MEIIVTANRNSLIAFDDLKRGDIFRMVNANDMRNFGANCLCMKIDTGEFIPLTDTKCGELCAGWEMFNSNNTIVEKVPNAVITLT